VEFSYERPLVVLGGARDVEADIPAGVFVCPAVQEETPLAMLQRAEVGLHGWFVVDQEPWIALDCPLSMTLTWTLG
jgi:hypothetical protein